MLQIFFFSAIIVSAVLNFAGLIVNLFIAVANYQTWLKSPRISSSNRILFSLGITRFLMLGLFLLNIIYFFISPNVERDLQIIFYGSSTNLRGFTGEIVPYERIIIHPNFTVTSPKDDLMLIKLPLPFTFSTKIFQLPTLKNAVKDCLIHTWLDNKDFIGNSNHKLQRVKIQLSSNINCKKLLGEKLLEDMFCIGPMLGSQEPCKVVTAAPAICGGELRGILSWETGCILTGYTVVFTDLHSYIPWIKNIMSTK
ncbi:taste receptor type 2 member 4 [Mirounga angustirostris]|uniref:taste receptor type 2 member 4 n=1 Tax=Mirounga angustirostris TaxID=9716 RepID=UPI00313EF9E7